MSKKRVIYQSDVLYVGPSPATATHISEDGATNYIKQLYRVTEVGFDMNVTRIDINQMGQLAAMERKVDDINSSVTARYNLTNGYNEKVLGLFVNNADTVSYADGEYNMVTPLSGFLSQSTAEKNYFGLTVGEGKDAILAAGSEYTDTERTTEHQVMAVGNGFVSNYSIEAAVGGLATASISIDGTNTTFEVGSSGKYIPAINESGCAYTTTYVIPTAHESPDSSMPSALRAGDITLDLSSNTVGGASFSEMHVQNFNISIPIARDPLKRLGTRLTYSREIRFPVTATISMSANIADLTSGTLASLLCGDEDSDLMFKLYDSNCVNVSGNCTRGTPEMVFYVKNANLVSQRVSNAVGNNSKTVDLSWEVQMGGIGDYDKGVFISGADTTYSA